MSTTTSVDLELIVWFYIRNEYESKFNKINIPIALKYLIVSFVKHVIGSKLLTLKEDIELTRLLLKKLSSIKRFDLLFHASENGFKSQDFHKCDNNGSTITIIKSNFGNIFGGYADIPWTSEGGYKIDPNAFLFMSRSKNNEINQNRCPLIFEMTEGRFSVYHGFRYAPAFGVGDLCIQNNCNDIATTDAYVTSNVINFQKIGYKNPVNWFTFDYGSLEGPLCGGNLKSRDRFCFQVLEYEVFKISKDCKQSEMDIDDDGIAIQDAEAVVVNFINNSSLSN